MIEDDYDEDADSDYDPEKDEEFVRDGNDTNGQSYEDDRDQVKEISFKRKRTANEIWNTMVDDDAKKTIACHNNAMLPFTDKSVQSYVNKKMKLMPSMSKKEKKTIQVNEMMAMIFGSGGSSSSSSSSSSNNNNSSSSNNNSSSSSSGSGSSSDSGSSIAKARKQTSSSSSYTSKENIKNIIKESVKNLKKKGKVFETHKFAGQEIRIERKLKDGESAVKIDIPAASIDAVIDSLKGPKTVSTIAKSSYDWDNFKEKEGLEDDLAKAGQDGYLTKKDFLERVDNNLFQHEKQEREAKRSLDSGHITKK